MPRLVIEKGLDKGKYIAVPERGTVVIGRDASAGLRLGDMMASRLHFRLETREDGVWLFDLKSMNGTFVNGERVQESRLNPGDRVQVGETLFTYVSDEDAEGQDALLDTVVSGYKVLERVGRGGMGTVYRAEQLSLKRIVALKVIGTEHTKDKTFVELFLREARAAAQLNHPNIVQVYDAKGAEGTYFYSMEFVPHGSVQDVLSAEKKLPPERAVKITLQAARGLEYAERKEIVHRDIKPDNLMIGELEVIKIADLGLAQSAKEASKLEESRTVLGTPHYIAPEQVLGRPADHRSDIYSLGATLYRILAGTTPYSGSNVMEIVQRKVREDPPSLHSLDPAIPKTLSDIVRKMMARKPEERYQKVSEVVVALETYLTAPASTMVAGAQAPGRPPKAVWIGAGAAAAVLLVVAVALLGGRGRPPVTPTGPTPPPDNTVPPVVNAGNPETEEELAQVYFQQASDFEARQLKKDREASIQEAIAKYQKIVDKCPRSSKVEEAQGRIAALRGLLASASASVALREAEQADADAFGRLLKRSGGRIPDLPLLRATTTEASARYEKVEQAHARTEAAKRARTLRDHIAGWLVLVEAAAARFGEIEASAQKEAADGRYGAGVALWKAYVQDLESKSLKSPCPDGRYGDLLAAAAAEGRIQELQADAANAFQQVQQEANVFVAAEKYEEAKACYRKVAETAGLPEIADRARQEIAGIDKKIIGKLDAERRAQEEKERLRIQEDDKRFTQATLAVQDLVKRYEFFKAVETFRKESAALLTDKNRAAAAGRLQDLEALARLKGEFIRRACAPPDASRDFLRAIRTKTQSGDIAAASDDRISIQVAVGAGGTGGSAEIPAKWTEFTPREFCNLFRSRWAMTAEDFLGFGCALKEFQFADEAEEAFKQAQAKATDDALRETATRRLEDLAATRGSAAGAGGREGDAERRLARARSLAEKKQYADAKTELEALIKGFADTDAVKKARAEIDALLKDATEKSKGGDDDRNRRPQRTQRYKEVSAQEVKDAQARRREVAAHLAAMTDDLERRHQTFLVAMAWQEWRQALAIGEDLRAALEPQIPAIAANGDLQIVSSTYAELLRLATINGDRIRFDKLAKEAGGHLANNAAWTGKIAPALAAWRDETFPAAVADMRKLKEEIAVDPAPDLLWRLAKIQAHDVPLRLDERQTLRALIDLQPDHPQVAGGDALFRLAANAVAFREIPYAQSLLAKLKADFGEKLKVKAAAIEALEEDCAALAQKLGYVKKP